MERDYRRHQLSLRFLPPPMPRGCRHVAQIARNRAFSSNREFILKSVVGNSGRASVVRFLRNARRPIPVEGSDIARPQLVRSRVVVVRRSSRGGSCRRIKQVNGSSDNYSSWQRTPEHWTTVAVSLGTQYPCRGRLGQFAPLIRHFR
jgi:hypothetical protein